MENPIVHSDFLLGNDVARTLYHEYAAKMPIIDYHNHLSAKDIATDKRFGNLTEIWLNNDHYKWRAMRANGVPEKYITGKASPKEKFYKWVETVPYTMRNPLYHWTHLELKHPFGINAILNESSAEHTYKAANEYLAGVDSGTWNILKQFNVKKLCTTEGPLDSLEWHRALMKGELDIKVSMAWRPDAAMDLRCPEGFVDFVSGLEKVCQCDITSYSDYLEALKERHGFFHENGCRLADHGLEFPFPVSTYTKKELETIFLKIREGKPLELEEQSKIMTDVLYEFAVWNAESGWAQQFHIGALRDVNQKGVAQVGKSSGFDSIADFAYARSMGQFFNRLELEGKLTKTIIYNLNPKDNAMMASMIGNFQDGSFPGKMQYGSGWWFLDQKDGMEKQLNTLSNQGLLSRFIGMLTDSRSFLSFSRHEYFRRILCNLLGKDVVKGELPKDIDFLGKMVQDICYINADKYFAF